MRHRLSGLELAVEFVATRPWTMLFGPSGSGKSTVLRAVAGFLRPDVGRVAVGSEVMFDSATRVDLRADRRPVRMAGQTARLFPTMEVAANVRYGTGAGADCYGEVMRMFRLERLAGRLPRELSGGERQRVSVARAVVAAATYAGSGRPLLMLDEPFSGMDLGMRDELAVELQEWLAAREISVLSVSHDIGEAFLLGAEVIRMADGKVVGRGAAAEVLAAERAALLRRLES